MINSLYNLTRKGWLKALSFILAIAMFALILLNAADFAHLFGGKFPYLAIGVFYGMAILFVHAVGFELKSTLWQCVFLPITGYTIVITSMAVLIGAK